MMYPTMPPAEGPEMNAVVSPALRARRNDPHYRLAMILFPLLLLFGGACICPTSVYRPAQVTVRATNAETYLYLDIMPSGVYTPTGDGRVVLDGQSEPAAANLDDLAEQGYVAVRVPHAPPDYAPSVLSAGDAGGGYAGYFRYSLPPDNPDQAIVPITLTRHSELETTINARFPITDGRSHWEVWWLPAGEGFPTPPGPFAVRSQLPPPLGLTFRIDFGVDGVAPCNGCTYAYAAFDGNTLMGPYTGTLTYSGGPASPYASFGSECLHSPAQIASTGSQLLTPNQPFTYTYCLQNYDRQAHTFQVEPQSQQGWSYTYFTQTMTADSAPVSVGSAPFQTLVGGYQGGNPGLMAIHAVYTPDFAADASLAEVLQLQATSVVSPTLQANGISTGASLAFDPQRQREEKLYMPAMSKP